MKNILKKTAIISLCFITMMTAMSGCSQKNKLSVNDCLSYMKDKYGIEFTLLDDNGINEVTSSVLEIYVQCSEYPGKRILVMEERLNNGESAVFHDNFLFVKYNEQTKATAEQFASEVYGECKVVCEISAYGVQPDEFDSTTTFEEFCAVRASDIWFEVLLPTNHSDSDKENELKKLEQKCIDNRFACICDVYYMSDADAYNNIKTHVDLMQSGSSSWSVAGKFLLDNDFNVTGETWR